MHIYMDSSRLKLVEEDITISGPVTLPRHVCRYDAAFAYMRYEEDGHTFTSAGSAMDLDEVRRHRCSARGSAA